MKRVTAFVGSARKKHTHNAVQQFVNNLQSLGDIEYEIIALSDYRIETCKGCKACLDKCESSAPLMMTATCSSRRCSRLMGWSLHLPTTRSRYQRS
jgi:multimeric flavodoxin WrbA